MKQTDERTNSPTGHSTASEIVLRPAHGKDGPIFTENGNFILNTRFNYISSSLEEQLKAITGVIESGLFIGSDIVVIVAKK